MHYELNREDGEHIDTFHDRDEADARAALVLGVAPTVSGSSIERPGYCIITLTGNDQTLHLHAFDECEDCDDGAPLPVAPGDDYDGPSWKDVYGDQS